MWERSFDLENHAFQIAHHICIGKAQDLVPLRLAVGVTPSVIFCRLIVACTVEFDDEFRPTAQKISEIGADWHLAAEFMA